jgi:hypothetical protein
LGISTLVSEVHSLNAPPPILVTDVGILIALSEEHSEKAVLPIEVTLDGSVIDSRFLQLLKALVGTEVAFVITTLFSLMGRPPSELFIEDELKIEPKWLLELLPIYGRVIFVRDAQPPNAQLPIEVTEPGMVMLEISLQLKNAYCPMNVTLLGMFIEPSDEQP